MISVEKRLPRLSPSQLIRQQSRYGEIPLEENDTQCSVCHSDNLTRHGTVVCQDCGATLGPVIQYTPETQFSANDDSRGANRYQE